MCFIYIFLIILDLTRKGSTISYVTKLSEEQEMIETPFTQNEHISHVIISQSSRTVSIFGAILKPFFPVF